MRVTFIAAVVGLLLYTGASAGQSGKQSKGKGQDTAPPTRGSQETSTKTYGGKTFDQWRIEMKSEDASKRDAAIMAITGFGAEMAGKAVPDFLARLRDYDVGVRAKACWVLRFVYVDASHVRQVVDGLAGRIVPGLFPERESQAKVRYEAAVSLLRFANDAGPVSSKVLLGLQDRSSHEVRRTCVSILWRIGVKGTGKDGKDGPDPAIVNGLLDALRNEHAYHVRLEILQGLGAMPKTNNKVIQARMGNDLMGAATSLRTPRPLAIWAYAALVSHGEAATSKKALTTIARYLNNPDVETKVQALMALGAVGKDAKNQVPLVLQMLKKEKDNALVVQAACMALYRMGDTGNTVVDTLIELLGHKDPHAAAAAVKAIVDLKLTDERVIKALDKMLENKQLDDNLTAWVKAALKELRGQKK